MKNILPAVILSLLLPIALLQSQTWTQQTSDTYDTFRSVYFSDATHGTAVGANGMIMRTTNGGSTWTSQTSGTGEWLQAVSFSDNNNGVAVGGNGVILKTTNGGANWALQTSGTANTLYSVSFSDANKGTAVGWGSGLILRTTDGGTTWGAQSTDYQSTLYGVSFFDANKGVATGEDGYLLTTTNGGTTWTSQAIPSTGRFTPVDFVDANTVYAATSGSIYKSTNGGSTWALKFSLSAEINGLFFLDANNGVAVGGAMMDGPVVYSTSDGGTSWTQQTTPGGGMGYMTSAFFVNANLGFVVGTDGLIINTSNGVLPVELMSFTANINASGIMLNWKTATEVNNYGFDIERKSASTWTKVGFVEGHGTTNAPQSYRYSDNSEAGKIVYRLKQIDRDGKFEYSQTVEVTAVTAPKEFALAQNFPNPFNPTTSISFTVPSNGHATLKILNILGQEVATLFNGEAVGGMYNQVQFNASAFASGVYFSRLECGGKVLMKNMTLVK